MHMSESTWGTPPPSRQATSGSSSSSRPTGSAPIDSANATGCQQARSARTSGIAVGAFIDRPPGRGTLAVIPAPASRHATWAGSGRVVEHLDHPLADLIADTANDVQRLSGRILELPVEVALAGDVRALVA